MIRRIVGVLYFLGGVTLILIFVGQFFNPFDLNEPDYGVYLNLYSIAYYVIGSLITFGLLWLGLYGMRSNKEWSTMEKVQYYFIFAFSLFFILLVFFLFYVVAYLMVGQPIKLF